MTKEKKQGAHINREIFLQFTLHFIPLLIVVLSVSTFLYYNETRTEREITRLYEQETTDLQQKAILNTLGNIVSDLRVLAAHHALHGQQSGTESKLDKEALTTEFLAFSKHKKIYDQIRLLNINGMEVIRVNYNDGKPAVVPREQLQNKGGRYYFIDTVTLSRNQVFVSPFDLNIEKGVVERPLKPMIRFGIPVFDGNGHKFGVVILNYLGKHLFEQIERLSIGSPGQVMLLNPQGYWMKGPHPENEWGFMFQDRNGLTFQNSFPEAWKSVSVKPSGQFLNKEGLFTFESVSPFPKDLKSSDGSPAPYQASTRTFHAGDYKWLLVSYISPQAYHAGMRQVQTRMFWVNALILLIGGIGSGYIATAKVRKKQADLARLELIADLQEALENIKTLSGMLPICSKCKKVRDDTGYWNQIETYIETRSEAQFSHGVCPECAEKLYGSEDWYQEWRKK